MKGRVEEVELKSGEIRYKATIDVPSQDGSRNRKSRTFDTKSEADDWLVKMNHMLNEEVYNEPSTMKLGEFLDVWCKRVKNGINQRTVEKREWAIGHIEDELGSFPIKDVTPFHVQSFYETKLLHLSSSTVHELAKILNMALKHAVKQKLLEENPCEPIDPPQPDHPEMSCLNEEQCQKLLEHIDGDWPYDHVYYLAIKTGMRMSEMIGLKWDEVYLEENKLRVRRQLKQSESYEFLWDSPKTESSNRTIRLSDRTVARLKRHRSEYRERQTQSEEWGDDDLVFTRPSGKHLIHGTVRDKLKKALRRSDCPVVRFQDLRHTCATLLLGSGVNPKVVQERLGHSRVSTTMDKYSHVLPDMQKKAVTKMDKLLGL
jgi:integrase